MLSAEGMISIHKRSADIVKRKNVYKTFAVDYVEMTEGTGIVTVNPAYGEIDFETGKKFYNEVLTIDPNDYIALCSIGAVYANYGEFDEAERYLNLSESKLKIWYKK